MLGAAYRRTEELVVRHTEVDPSLAGRASAARWSRARWTTFAGGLGLRVLPICPCVHAWMLRHPEYAELDFRQPASVVVH